MTDGLLPGGRFAEWRPPHAVGYVACDVDGTLVGSGLHPTDAVVEAVADATADDVAVGIVTGRMRDAVAELSRRLCARGPHVLHNGAEIVTADGEVITDRCLDVDHLGSLLSIGRDAGDGVLEIYTRSGFVTSSLDPRAEAHWEIIGARPRAVIDAPADLGGAAVLKATYTAFSAQTAAAVCTAATAAGLNATTATSPRTPQLVYVNLTHPLADKGTAVAAIAERLGTTPADVVAVGDAGNDLPMLSLAGTAVAMGQAPAEVIDACHLVAPGVGDDGVVAVLAAARRWAAGRSVADRSAAGR